MTGIIASGAGGWYQFYSLIVDLGSVEALAELEANCVERYLCHRDTGTLKETIHEATELPPWNERIKGLSPVKKSRFRQKLGEEILSTSKAE
jgi:hypothetical protein